MKCRFVPARAVAAVCLCVAISVQSVGAFGDSPTGASLSKEAALKFGAYDPQDAFGRQALSFDHHFVSWLDLDRVAFQTAHKMAVLRGRDLLISVEPFTRAPRPSFFKRILSGGYDTEIKTVCTEIGRFGTTVLVRWGHEMDDRSGRYPWAQADSAGYVQAYRYFVKECRRLAPQALFVWSPMGNRSPAKYYPGDAYVDFVGLPIWGLQSFDRHYFGKARSFGDLLSEKYNLVRQHNKPIIVAEFGVSGSSQYRQFVLSGLSKASESFPLLHSVVYFNMKEPYHWPRPFGSPDWRIEPGFFSDSVNRK
jgi:endoglucanase